jgi:hypothetical protein
MVKRPIRKITLKINKLQRDNNNLKNKNNLNKKGQETIMKNKSKTNLMITQHKATKLKPKRKRKKKRYNMKLFNVSEMLLKTIRKISNLRKYLLYQILTFKPWQAKLRSFSLYLRQNNNLRED